MQFNEDLISFVIPVEDPSYLRLDNLSSVNSQKANGFRTEIILVNNSSLALQNPFPESITVLNEPKKGPQHARNKGVLHARGKWLAFVDCDVVLAPDWLSTMLESMREKMLGGAQSSLHLSSDRLDTQFAAFRKLSQKLSHDGEDMLSFFFPVLNTSACIFDRTKTGQVLFNESFQKCEDCELSWRIFVTTQASFGFVKNAVATCYFGNEEFSSFMIRNFTIGRYYRMLVDSYSYKFPMIKEWQRDRLMAQLRNHWKVFVDIFSIPSFMRFLATAVLFAGYHSRPRIRSTEFRLTSVGGKRMTHLSNAILIHDMKTCQRVSIKEHEDLSHG